MNHPERRLESSLNAQHLSATVLRYLGYAILIASALLCMLNPAISHPHSWIDLRSTVVLDGNGQVIAIEQEWLFDDFYSIFVTEDVSQTAADQKKALTDLAETNLNNLREYDYFTEVRIGGAKAKLDVVREFESELRNGRLWMRFVVPLAEPVDLSAKLLSFAVYDPTYYVEILHLEGDVVAFKGGGVAQCTGQVIRPKPSFEMVSLAQALDRDAEPDNTLGRMFAEQVEVSCR